MFIHSIDPVALHLGPLEIRWYGIIFALGFLLAYWYVQRQVKKKNIVFDADSFFIYIIIGAVIGARLFEVLFYSPSYYFSNPLQVFAVWKGGLSFHGGLLGGFLAGFWSCKKQNLSWKIVADLLAIPLALGLAFGRIANFINGELYGYPTALPWAVDFGDGIFRHPTQLYESLKNFLIAGALFVIKQRKSLQSGMLFMLFFVMYGFIRFFIEFLKVPETSFAGLATGQWFSLIMVVIGIIGIRRLKK
ncbi:MAG TPA: prolipoprotein diacylglyceryl transferase [Candidatus Nanoarchaeia archaeon]|nr:prolipoprotein diacylglyceryl transferase [Candidatus Nanoarchaeia archaeon]